MRQLHEIAQEIERDFTGDKAKFARLYIEAMKSLSSMNDRYGLDVGRSIVLYFLANAQTWRGEIARRIKAELNSMLKQRGNS